MQFPEELQQPGSRVHAAVEVPASMKCSFPEELQHRPHERTVVLVVASMKCSSRRNYNPAC